MSRAPASAPDPRDEWVREGTAFRSWAQLVRELDRGWTPTLRSDLYERGSHGYLALRALRRAVAEYLVIELDCDVIEVAERRMHPALDERERRRLVRRMHRAARRLTAGAA